MSITYSHKSPSWQAAVLNPHLSNQTPWCPGPATSRRTPQPLGLAWALSGMAPLGSKAAPIFLELFQLARKLSSCNCALWPCTSMPNKIYLHFKWPISKCLTWVLLLWQQSVAVPGTAGAGNAFHSTENDTPEVKWLFLGTGRIPLHSGTPHAQPWIVALVLIKLRWYRLTEAMNFLSGIKVEVREARKGTERIWFCLLKGTSTGESGGLLTLLRMSDLCPPLRAIEYGTFTISKAQQQIEKRGDGE